MNETGSPQSVTRADILNTYFYLRIGMGFVALLLPIVLWLVGKLWMKIPMQESMSAYYHTDMRDIFVGALFAMGFSLLVYKGFSRSEDWALNIAGVLALGIAFFPTDPTGILLCLEPCEAGCMGFSSVLDRTLQALIDSRLHGKCAVLFFAAIAYVCAFASRRTLHLIRDLRIRRSYLWTYRVLGLAMFVLPLLAWWITSSDARSAGDCHNFTVFRMEAVAVWVFGTFWLVKTYEGARYGADRVYPNRRAIPEEKAREI